MVKIESFDTTDFTVKIAAEVKDFDPKDYMEKKKLKDKTDIVNLQLLHLN